MPKHEFLRTADNSPNYQSMDVDYQQCSLPNYFERMVIRYPNNLLVSDNSISYTYAQGNAVANQLANCLMNNRLDGRVGVYLPNCADFVICFLGVMKANCAAVMIDPTLPIERAKYMLQDAKVSAVISSLEYEVEVLDLVDTLCPVFYIDEAMEKFSAKNSENLIPINAPAVLVYTSGSTGNPKGVLHTHRAWMTSIAYVAQCEKYVPEDRIAQVYSPSSAASLIGVVYAFLTGASVHMYDVNKLGLPFFVDWIQENGITAFRMTGTAFRQVFSGKPKPEKMAKVRLAMVGGEMVHKKDFETFKTWFSEDTLQRVGGGATEVLLIASCYLNHESLVERKHMPMGYVFDTLTVEIWGDDNLPLPVGEVGEIVVRGPSVANGYWNSPDNNGGFFLDPDNPDVYAYRMGDMGYLTKDGLLYIGGRIDHMVKVRGYRVEVGEVESRLVKVTGVQQAVVIAKPARDGSSVLIAYIVPDIQHVPGIRAIREELLIHLPDYMVPVKYIFMNKFPVNTSGKVDRFSLPEPGNHRPDLDIPYAQPETYIQKELVSIWEEVLGINGIGIDDGFSLLGGDSLSATQIFIMIEEGLNKKLPPSILINSPTIRMLAEKLFNYRKGQENDLMILREAQIGQPSLILFAPLFGDVIIFRDLLQQLPEDIGVIGIQSWTKERETFGQKSIDEMLDEFLPLVERIFPVGPYYLGGFSLGGVLAYQAASRLSNTGKEIGFVFMLDVSGPGVINKFDPKEYLFWFRKQKTIYGKFIYLWRGVKKVYHSITHKFKKPGAIKDSVNLPKKTEYVPLSVLKKPYAAPELDVDVFLFTSDERKGAQNRKNGYALGWDRVVKGKLIVNHLEGNHEEHFRGENAKNITEILIKGLEEREK